MIGIGALETANSVYRTKKAACPETRFWFGANNGWRDERARRRCGRGSCWRGLSKGHVSGCRCANAKPRSQLPKRPASATPTACGKCPAPATSHPARSHPSEPQIHPNLHSCTDHLTPLSKGYKKTSNSSPFLDFSFLLFFLALRGNLVNLKRYRED